MIGDREHLHRILTAISLTRGRYFIGGSGPLALRGLREATDLDIGVTTAYWFELERDPDWALTLPSEVDVETACDPAYLSQMVYGLPVHVFAGWRQRSFQKPDTHDFNLIFREHVEMLGEGWPCLDLETLLLQKVEAIRQKDAIDIGMIVKLLYGADPDAPRRGPYIKAEDIPF